MNDQTGEIAYWMSRAEDYQRERNELYKAWKAAENRVEELQRQVMEESERLIVSQSTYKMLQRQIVELKQQLQNYRDMEQDNSQ